jgi:predicted dehydrogenase
MSRETRRTFLKQAAAASIATTFTIAGTKASGKVLGANDTVRIGVAGIHGRGQNHIKEWLGMKNVQLTYLIDPDSSLFDARSATVKKGSGNTPKCVQDVRKALEDKELDAVSIATCNHWHSLITIWACQAGKDVYVEKPCSHNVFEGRKCVEAAKKYGRIVQHGTQSRGSQGWAQAAAAIASGKYGKLLVSKAYASKVRWSIGFKEVEQPPKELDYNLWCGPAPLMPYHKNLVHYNWHWFWETGNGEIGNQGVHQMDIARWVIPGSKLPKSVVSLGGRWVDEPKFKDQGVTPNMQLAVMDFGGPLLVFEVCGLNGKTIAPKGKKMSTKVDNEFYLTEGKIIKGKFYPKGSDKGESLPEVDMPKGGVFQNFIDCVRTRKAENLLAPITEAHFSAACCHLANISYRLGKEVPGSVEPQGLPDNEHVHDSWSTIKEYLPNTLGLEMAKTSYTMGKVLQFDPASEKFVGSDEANKLLTRDYRAPFVVPEQV